MLRKHNSKLQNSPNFRQFSAADLNISRDSRAGFFLKRAQDVPNYSSTADNFLVENGRRSPIETSKKQVQKFVRFNHLSSAQIENSLEISAENSLHSGFQLRSISNGYISPIRSLEPPDEAQIDAPRPQRRTRLPRGQAPTCSLMDLRPNPPRRLDLESRAQPTSTSTSTYADFDDQESAEQVESIRHDLNTRIEADGRQASPIESFSPLLPSLSPLHSPESNREVPAGPQVEDEIRAPTPPEETVHRNFVQDLGPLSKLLDISCDQMGTLTGLANTIKFIPENLVNEVRIIWTKNLKRVTEHPDPRSNNPELIRSFKKVFLTPVILLDNSGNARDLKATMKSKISLMHRDEWDSFTLGSLKLRPFLEASESTDEQRKRKTSTFVENGRLSRGYQEWVKPRSFIQQNEQVFEALCPLYPDVGPAHFTEEERANYIQRVAEFENAHRSEDNLASIERVGKIIMKRENLIKPGFDHNRAEFVKKLWGFSDNEPLQVDFRKHYTKYVNMIYQRRLPPAVEPLFCDTEAFAIPKKDGNIRPLGTSNFERKIAGVVALQLNHLPIKAAFSGIQLGFERHGTEAIIHSMRVAQEVNPEYCSASPDGVNAFPNSSREVALDETLRSTPGMFPLLNMLYGQVSKSWFFGCQDGIKSIDCKQGSVQGCSLGPFECAMAFLQLFRRIAALVLGFGVALFFFDDGNMVTTFSKMLDALAILINDGPQFGYKIHFDKGDFLLGVANSFDTARERKQQLIDLGFKSENIKIHPDDLALGSDDDLQDLGIADLEQAKQTYGARILGGFIGDDAFIKCQLRAKAVELEAEAERLIALGDPQQCLLFLRYCLGEKINHILRTTYPCLVEELAERFDTAKKKVLCFILDQFDADNLPAWVWTQACFTVNDGGLGLKDSIRTSHAAFVASAFDNLAHVEKACPGFTDLDIPYLRELRKSLQFISQTASTPGREVNLDFQRVQAMQIAVENKPNRGGLQYQLSQLMDDAIRKTFTDSLSNKHLAFYNSVACEFAGLWLNVLPKNSTFTFDPAKTRVLLSNRFYLRQPEFCDGLRCDCVMRRANAREHPLIDEKCHHLITGCNKSAFGIKIHHATALAIKDLAQSAGFRAKTEEVGTFQDYTGILSEVEKRMRGDVTIFDLPGGFRKTILDVSNTKIHPILSDAPFSRDEAKVEFSAQRRYDERVRKFDHATTVLNFKFQPIIFEITGRLHAKSDAFINSILKHITGFKDGALLQDYWRKKIACTFQHGVGSHILDKLRMLKGQRFAHQYYENRSNYAYESALEDANMR